MNTHYEPAMKEAIETLELRIKQIEAHSNGSPEYAAMAKRQIRIHRQAIQMIQNSTLAIQELKNIAYTKLSEWDDPSDFEGWAKSRARHTLEKLGEKDLAGH